jgi:hypothetical protein
MTGTPANASGIVIESGSSDLFSIMNLPSVESSIRSRTLIWPDSIAEKNSTDLNPSATSRVAVTLVEFFAGFSSSAETGLNVSEPQTSSTAKRQNFLDIRTNLQANAPDLAVDADYAVRTVESEKPMNRLRLFKNT